MEMVWILALFCLASSLLSSSAEQCGKQASGALCPNGLCCSEYGYCGSTEQYCGAGCQSQCWAPPPPASPPPPPPPFAPPPPPGQGVDAIITSTVFDDMLRHKDDPRCHAVGFYTYQSFIDAANSFPGFGTSGNDEARRRELAAFFGQTSHEIGGGTGWTPEDGPFYWGYCWKEEQNPSWNYCTESARYPCVPGKSYHGRGPIQLSHNANYGQCGEALGVDLLRQPELLATDPVLSFKASIWFWMTVQAPKPSCHDVMIETWTPSSSDVAAGRLPGYGLVTNIINGGLECGRPGPDARVENRIGYYQRYCDMFGVGYGDNLDCYGMTPYGLTLPHKDETLVSAS